jgi:hypothetical protein
MLVKLRHLLLHLGETLPEAAGTSQPSSDTIIHDLNILEVSGPEGGTFHPLFTAFITMYPSVRHVALYRFSTFPQVCAAYIASLAYIETLNFTYGTDPTSLQPIVHLPSLQSLIAWGHHTLEYFELPNLLTLDLVFLQDSTRLNMVRFPCLRKLTIRQSSDLDLHLKPSDYPELRMLTIIHQNFRWELSSLPKLVSITLDSSVSNQHSGTLLCAALLFRPEYCPALQQISFSQPVEWEMLFLMLERRNRGTEYVSRIDVVDLPFIPFMLRRPLRLLLEGRSAERPSNLELSFEGARELVCDCTM